MFICKSELNHFSAVSSSFFAVKQKMEQKPYHKNIRILKLSALVYALCLLDPAKGSRYRNISTLSGEKNKTGRAMLHSVFNNTVEYFSCRVVGPGRICAKDSILGIIRPYLFSTFCPIEMSDKHQRLIAGATFPLLSLLKGKVIYELLVQITVLQFSWRLGFGLGTCFHIYTGCLHKS